MADAVTIAPLSDAAEYSADGFFLAVTLEDQVKIFNSHTYECGSGRGLGDCM